MININLLPWREEQLKTERSATITLLVISVALSLVFIFIAYLYLSSNLQQQKRRNQTIQLETTKLNATMQNTNRLKKQKSLLENNIKQFEDIQYDRYQNVKIINEVTAIIPKTIYLFTFIKIKNEVTLSGETHSVQSVPLLVKNIDVNLKFYKPTISEIITKQKNGINITAFKLGFSATNLKPKISPLKKSKRGRTK